jgi:hypothetical protein
VNKPESSLIRTLNRKNRLRMKRGRIFVSYSLSATLLLGEIGSLFRNTPEKNPSCFGEGAGGGNIKTKQRKDDQR